MKGLRSLVGIGSLGLLGLAGLAGCKQDEIFGDVTKFRDRLVDFQNQQFWGQERREYRATVTADMIHPSFEGHWTFRDPEKPLDIYVFASNRYRSGQPLSQQDTTYFWASVRNATGGLGQLRDTEMHIHPTPGDWVIVIYNNAVPNNPVTRAEAAAEIDLTYFKR
jgi:hypothetical protein